MFIQASVNAHLLRTTRHFKTQPILIIVPTHLSSPLFTPTKQESTCLTHNTTIKAVSNDARWVYQELHTHTLWRKKKKGTRPRTWTTRSTRGCCGASRAPDSCTCCRRASRGSSLRGTSADRRSRPDARRSARRSRRRTAGASAARPLELQKETQLNVG